MRRRPRQDRKDGTTDFRGAPHPSPGSFLPLFALFLLCPWLCRAEVSPVSIRVPQPEAWTGQRLPFFVELRASGSFAGAAGFSLPEVPRSVILKVGNPIVSSREIEGESWFVQTHEFALFSQQSGQVEIPSFPVRFGSRDGFTGPVTEREATVPAARVEIRRPPGTDNLGFLITTESLELTETWEPQPGPAEVGAVFKRTIGQRADQMTGMALAAPPAGAPDGIRIYPGQAEVRDKMERGDFLGERRETITYLLQEPGTRELPALTYVWWDPKAEELRSKTFPAVTIEVAPSATSTAPAGIPGALRKMWPWLLATAAAMIALTTWQRRRLARLLVRCWRALNPPERTAARHLLAACRRHDAAAAQAAWNQWRSMQGSRFFPGPALQAAVLEMQRHLFGPPATDAWRGDALAESVTALRSETKSPGPSQEQSALPPLNAR